MKTRTLFIAVLIILLAGCARTQKSDYLQWLYANMPLADSLGYSRAFWEENVAVTLEVRDAMGWNVPEREFVHFVLPLRVGNEALDNFRTTYADTLCRRVKGLGIAEAALEINRWCHEQATYQPSDARTSSPMQTVKRGVGRCGEESVLAVAALRAAGIPARQVYTPRWAHTDDNHAWVEVWAEGKWWFMGACEPEPRLNMAWFNAPVSRAMLLHTKVFGDYNGAEDVISRQPGRTEINVIDGYVPSRPNRVTVLDSEHRPVEGARVLYKIYNYAEFYTVADYLSDSQGVSSLNTGKGDLLVWAFKGDDFGFAVAGSEETTVVLDHKIGESFGVDIDIEPPVENPIVTDADYEDIARNVLLLAREDSIRAAHDHCNHDLESFSRRRAAGVQELIDCLTDKDHGDVSLEVLEDALEGAAVIGDPYVLSPRVELEPLRPYRRAILKSGLAERLHTPQDVIRWVRDSIAIVDDRNVYGLRIPPAVVWESRTSDSHSRDIFFVALCRVLGIPARLNEVTGKTQYREGGNWLDVEFEGAAEPVLAPKGRVRFLCDSDPKYYRHFTVSKIIDGYPVLQVFGSDSDFAPLSSIDDSLDVGDYVLTTGTRLSSGGVLAHMQFFSVAEGQTVEVPVQFRRSDDKLSVIGNIDAERLFLPDGADEQQSILSATGRGVFLLAVMGDKDEPSSHALHEMEAVRDELNAWGRPVLILGNARPQGLDNSIFGQDLDGKVRRMLGSTTTLPAVAICDSFGSVFFLSEGYDTSLGQGLVDAIGKL